MRGVRVEFDPGTGLMTRMSGMRYRGGEEEKTPWRGEASSWRTQRGRTVPYRLTATWEDQTKPYVVLDLEGAAYDADVSGKVFGCIG